LCGLFFASYFPNVWSNSNKILHLVNVKSKEMKKVLLFALLSGFIFACSSGEKPASDEAAPEATQVEEAAPAATDAAEEAQPEEAAPEAMEEGEAAEGEAMEAEATDGEAAEATEEAAKEE